MKDSKIQWTRHTANLWHGCTKVHAGCDHCYAETQSKRSGRDIWGNDKPRLEIKSVWDDLDKYQKIAKDAGENHTVFLGSMMDIFEKPMPLIDSKGDLTGFNTDYLRTLFFEALDDGRYENLIFLFLTKRPSNINKYIPVRWHNNPPENIMFGTSPCDQATADNLIPQLLQVSGKRFLSCEPLLGPIDLSRLHISGNMREGNLMYSDDDLHWIIVGGESGPSARPMHPDWVRSLRDQCKDADVPFFFKQWGEYLPECQDEGIFPDLITTNAIRKFQSPHNPNKMNSYYKIGKHNAGNVLDGKTHLEYPNEFINLK